MFTVKKAGPSSQGPKVSNVTTICVLVMLLAGSFYLGRVSILAGGDGGGGSAGGGGAGGTAAAAAAAAAAGAAAADKAPQPPKRQLTTSLKALDDFADKIAANVNITAKCNARVFGKGWGGHTLCNNHKPAQPCYFYSFGTSHDYSFDVDVANSFGCYGFCADPTTNHNSVLHSKVTFHYIAAKSLRDEDNRNFWFYTSVPALRKMMKHDRVAVLKMDCEGCEYSVAADVLAEDPEFFHHVQQFAVEVHFSKKWCKAHEELSSFVTLLELLSEAGLELIEVMVTPCAPSDQASGLVPELESRAKKMRLEEGHCHNYLFARLDSKSA